MKKIFTACILIVVGLALTGCKTTNASGQKMYKPELVQHIRGSSFKATERGYYTAELVTKPKPPIVGENSAQLIIHDYKATDRGGLTITATPYLPAKDMTSESPVSVKDAGRGLYLLEGIKITEPGKWQMKLTISGPEETDSVVLDLPKVK